jgi:hypothetical protein
MHSSISARVNGLNGLLIIAGCHLVGLWRGYALIVPLIELLTLQNPVAFALRQRFGIVIRLDLALSIGPPAAAERRCCTLVLNRSELNEKEALL